jgi:hypothetical protein
LEVVEHKKEAAKVIAKSDAAEEKAQAAGIAGDEAAAKEVAGAGSGKVGTKPAKKKADAEAAAFF